MKQALSSRNPCHNRLQISGAAAAVARPHRLAPRQRSLAATCHAGPEQQQRTRHPSRRAAVTAPLLLLPTVQPAHAAGAAAAGAAPAPWAFHRRQLLSLLSISSDYNKYAGSYEQLDAGALPEALGFAELRQKLIAQVGVCAWAAGGGGVDCGWLQPQQTRGLARTNAQ